MPRDPRSTPAPPKDRIRGSAANLPGSASSARSGRGIRYGEGVTKALERKVAENASRGVTLGMLKSVYRRGSGAYSTSHRPGVSRAAWAMARVDAFLHLVRCGRPRNPRYVQDNDLLPPKLRQRLAKRSAKDKDTLARIKASL